MRPICDMIAGVNAPIAPGADPAGWRLDELEARECRFPVGRRDDGTRFCAAEVTGWQPGAPLGCYCGFHRDYLRGQPSVVDEERRAA